MSEKFPITSQGALKMEAELKDLRNSQRPAVIQAIAEAREHGDLSENAEYHAAREKQGFIEGRIADLEDKMARAEIIATADLSGEVVMFGAIVTIVNEETDEEKTYQIVSDYEADLNAGRIAHMTPIAQALIGKKVGDSVEVHTPNGVRYYEILDVKYE